VRVTHTHTHTDANFLSNTHTHTHTFVLLFAGCLWICAVRDSVGGAGRAGSVGL